VRDAERLAQRWQNPPSPAAERAPDRDLLRLEEELSDALGAPVQIRANKKGAGKVSIEFGDLDQLEGLLGRLR
jgi:ParB family chromosome partitioning protein